MTDFSAQGPPDRSGPHLVLYDGVCGMCGRLLRFLLAHDRRTVFMFASLQSATGRDLVARSGGNPDELRSFYVLADFLTGDARVFNKSAAALFVAGELGWPWRAATLLRIVPMSLLDGLYDVVARHRYRVFGRDDRCTLPARDDRKRFVD